MRVGTYYFLQKPPGRAPEEVIAEEVDQMVLSETLGFDSVWLTEHHYADYGLSSAPTALLASLAARTERVRLGMAVYVLPFHHPLRLAEETATLDILSRGRLTVGLGRGNRPIEFLGHGVTQDESRTRLEEGVEVLLQAWTRDCVTFHGRHWQIDNVPVYPRPVQQPHPPFAFAVGSPESLRWAGSHGYAIMSSGLFTPLSTALRNRQIYLEALQQGGHPSEDLLSRWVYTKHVYVAETDAQARADAEGPERWFLDSYARSISPEGLNGISAAVRQQAAATVERVRGLRWEQLIEESLFIGSPATLRARIAELQKVGVGELLCWMNFGGIPPEKVRRSMQLFADEVLPEFHPGPRIVQHAR
jgi:alkanesulfonate monooxygenase SsuD/methylene tetrahydromethanopterin reductase-like flavin-dependent oxidoreductase (luciferase family)